MLYVQYLQYVFIVIILVEVFAIQSELRATNRFDKRDEENDEWLFVFLSYFQLEIDKIITQSSLTIELHQCTICITNTWVVKQILITLEYAYFTVDFIALV